MKWLFVIQFFLFICLQQANAAWIEKQEYSSALPDGSIFNGYISGDEYYQRIHDSQGYTIIQAIDGFFYYADLIDGSLVATPYKVNSVNPAFIGLIPNISISAAEYSNRKLEVSTELGKSSKIPNTGLLNNLTIYIKFYGDTEYATTRQTFDSKLNKEQGSSLKSYYKEVSYNAFEINSSYYPECSMSTNLSYTDSHAREYFLPYHATTNPEGYQNASIGMQREITLLRDAVNWMNINSPVPQDLNIDLDEDGKIDNVTFVLRGNSNSWGNVLWAHASSVNSSSIAINGKILGTYLFIPESQFSVTTLCHEMFHSLGAPDLYHYSSGSNPISPVSEWDLMGSGSGHMGAYMKWKYSQQKWISSIPEIVLSGTYSLHPLTVSSNNCFKIASPNSQHEFFIVEYRKKSGLYENGLPGTGLLVYRINELKNGNASGPPDEVYIYRPGGTLLANGNPYQANYSANTGRTQIDDESQPSSFLQDGSKGELHIFDIGMAGDSILFSVIITKVEAPHDFVSMQTEAKQITLQWAKNQSSNNVLLAFNTTRDIGNPIKGVRYAVGNVLPGGGQILYYGNLTQFKHSNIIPGRLNCYKLWSVSDTLAYSDGVTTEYTIDCQSRNLPFSEAFSGTGIPACWAQQFISSYPFYTWKVVASAKAGGESNELVSEPMWDYSDMTRIILPPINTTGVASLKLHFKHKYEHWWGSVALRVQSSTDSLIWTNEDWFITTAYTNIGPENIETTINHNLNSDHTFLAFTILGNSMAYTGWYIDDVFVAQSTDPVFSITTAAYPIASGSVSGGGSYSLYEQVVLKATASPGYHFVNWSQNGELFSADRICRFQADQSAGYIATFSSSDIGIKAESSNPTMGNATGTGAYEIGSAVSVAAQAYDGFVFTNWTYHGKVLSTNSNYSFKADSSMTLIAMFDTTYLHVETFSFPKNAGLTSGKGNYSYSNWVHLNASANPGWVFEGWYENSMLVSESPEFSFKVYSNRSFEARYTPEQVYFTLSLLAFPSHAGIVLGGGSFTEGSQVTISAKANTGWFFSGWEKQGISLTTDSVYSFQISANESLKAVFVKQLEIIATAFPAEGGTVSGSGTYLAGESIHLQAFANVNYKFIKWTEHDSILSYLPGLMISDTLDRFLVAHFQNTIGIENVVSNTAFEVFPNPTPGEIRVSCEKNKISAVEVLSLRGESIALKNDFEPCFSIQHDLMPIAPGLYILKVVFENQKNAFCKIIVLPSQ